VTDLSICMQIRGSFYVISLIQDYLAGPILIQVARKVVNRDDVSRQFQIIFEYNKALLLTRHFDYINSH
jgi:hypothetical protein